MMTRRSIVALGVVECINWGVLYYAFGVLLLPVQRDLGVSQAVVAGAFSVSLLVSAATAPAIGRLCDAGRGVQALRAGAAASALLLCIWASAPSLVTLYLAWAGLGACMAAALYEPAFAIVGRALPNPRAGLRALSTVTVFGGLASTIVLPAAAFLIDRWNWRVAVAVLGVAMLASCALTALLRDRDEPSPPGFDTSIDRRHSPGPGLHGLTMVFSIASLAMAAFAATAVAAFVERGLTATFAATLVGAFGLLQLPGRLMLMTGLHAGVADPGVVSLSAQAIGLGIIAVAPLPVVAVGVALLALGNGVMTLVRPYVVQTVVGDARAGAHNGAIARAQQFARALGPIGAASLASVVGYQLTLTVLAAALGAVAVWWRMNIHWSDTSVNEEVM